MKVTEGVTWTGICTERFEETVAFFRDVMSLQVKQEGVPKVDMQYARYCVFDAGNNVMLEVLQPKPEIKNRYSGPVLSFTVDDLDRAIQELKGKAELITAIIDDGATWRWIYFRAPDGNIYQLQQRY